MSMNIYNAESDKLTRVANIGGSNLLDYSTTEQDTGRKWIDGKPIYQKTIAIYENSQLVTGLTLTGKELSGDIIPQNIDKAISCKQITMRSTGYIDNGNFTDKSKVIVHQSEGTLYVDTDNDTPVYMYAILEYTKTTDTAEQPYEHRNSNNQSSIYFK